ncbi:hypothetical protein GN958_ATG07418, partial [Phytophthora infestans]
RVNELNQELGATELSNAELLAQFCQLNVDLCRDSEETLSKGMMEDKNEDTTRRGNEEIEETGMRAFTIVNRLREFRPLAAHIDGKSSPGFAYWIYGRIWPRTLITLRMNNWPFNALPRPAKKQKKPDHSGGKTQSGQNESVRRNRNPKTREAPKPTSPPVAKRPARDAGSRLQQRIELLPRGAVREPQETALNATVALKGTIPYLAKIFENMEFVAVSNLADLKHDELQAVWHMQLIDVPSVKSKRLGRYGMLLESYTSQGYLYNSCSINTGAATSHGSILQMYEIPADMVDSFRTRLLSILQHFEDAAMVLPDGAINKDMTFLNALLEGQIVTWDPRSGLSIRKLLAKAQ